MRTHFPWTELGYAVGAICLLLGLYVGSYYAMVSRMNPVHNVTVTETVPLTFIVAVPDGESEIRQIRQGTTTSTKIVPEISDAVVASYPPMDVLGADTLRTAFTPVHNLDRQIRVEFWKDQFLPSTPLPAPVFPTAPPFAPVPAGE